MIAPPSQNSDGGRDENGRFIKGYKGGPGNPHAKRVAELRAAMFAAVTAEDLREVIVAMVGAAKGGDVPAAKELLQRLLGPPTDWELDERLEQLEKMLLAAQPQGEKC